jgi:hypothetical protein
MANREFVAYQDPICGRCYQAAVRSEKNLLIVPFMTTAPGIDRLGDRPGRFASIVA